MKLGIGLILLIVAATFLTVRVNSYENPVKRRYENVRVERRLGLVDGLVNGVALPGTAIKEEIVAVFWDYMDFYHGNDGKEKPPGEWKPGEPLYYQDESSGAKLLKVLSVPFWFVWALMRGIFFALWYGIALFFQKASLFYYLAFLISSLVCYGLPLAPEE